MKPTAAPGGPLRWNVPLKRAFAEKCRLLKDNSADVKRVCVQSRGSLWIRVSPTQEEPQPLPVHAHRGHQVFDLLRHPIRVRILTHSHTHAHTHVISHSIKLDQSWFFFFSVEETMGWRRLTSGWGGTEVHCGKKGAETTWNWGAEEGEEQGLLQDQPSLCWRGCSMSEAWSPALLHVDDLVDVSLLSALLIAECSCLVSLGSGWRCRAPIIWFSKKRQENLWSWNFDNRRAKMWHEMSLPHRRVIESVQFIARPFKKDLLFHCSLSATN